jgi:DNA-binding protein HU-beta
MIRARFYFKTHDFMGVWAWRRKQRGPKVSMTGSESQQQRSAPVNKNDLIHQLSETTGLQKTDAAKAVDGVFDIITATLKAGDEVRLTGFGVFAVHDRAGGKGRNPQTGEEITIKPSKQPRFRAGKQLKDALN